MNRFVRVLGAAGLRLGPVAVLTVPGRTTGKPRTTPVTPFTVDGRRYIMAGVKNGDWARNTRAAGRGVLATGRRRAEVTLTEVTDPSQRRRVASQFPVEVPRGVSFYISLGLVTAADPEQFAAAADEMVVFEVSPGRPAPPAR
jgi:deazaflavin-dependent oxidoreductase (nitroreductase family)